MAIQAVSHIGLCVADLPRAERFYVEGLGFAREAALHVAGEPSSQLLDLSDVDLHAVYLLRDGVRIELLHYVAPETLEPEAPRPMNARGLTHLSLRVDDLEQELDRLSALGARVLPTSRIAPHPGTGAVFVLDPDGTRIELVQAPGDPRQPPGVAADAH